jgi:hypothetical protein
MKHPKHDIDFATALAKLEGDLNFAIFQDLAEAQFPGVPYESLIPFIDFTKVPTAYSIKVIEPGGSRHPEEGANESFLRYVEKFKGTGTTVVQAKISRGATVEFLTTTMEKKNFWTDKSPR